MDNGIEFMSVFKIAEKPILRPCLSEEKREQIRCIKAEALEIERRIAEQKKRSTIEKIEDIEILSDSNTDNDVDDNFTISISECHLSSTLSTNDDNTITKNCGLGRLEAVGCLSDSTDQYDSSASAKAKLSQPMIRSNSFTVDEPSIYFLKHLEDNGVATPIKPITTSIVDLSTKTELLNKNKILSKESVKRKTESKKIATPKLKKYSTKLFGIKKGRLSSDNISNLPEKVIRKNQSKAVHMPELRKGKPVTKSFITTTPRKTSLQDASSFTQTVSRPYLEAAEKSANNSKSEILANIEEKYRTEIIYFLEKQKREQDAFLRKVMSQIKSKQETFQHEIVIQLKALIDDSISKLMINHTNSTDQSNITYRMNDLNGNDSNFGGVERKHADINNYATKINACVRGYLTRRLFKTEQVQQIAKTIRDSRDLVIDLHMENIDEDSPADAQTKHNLLQQLQLNKRMLLNIFTTSTIAERMGMIAFDRQMMNFRLVQNNVRNNNNRAMELSYINQSTDFKTIENKLKKLRIVKLFSDSISGYDAIACSIEFQDM